MQNLSNHTSSLNTLHTHFLDIIKLYREVLHQRYQEIVEFYQEDKLDLPFSEKIYIQGFMDGFLKGLGEKE